MQGLEVYDQNQQLVFGTTDRLTVILGSIIIPKDSPTISGTITEPALLKGTPFYFTVDNDILKNGYSDGRGWSHGWYQYNGTSRPTTCFAAFGVDITFTGSTLSWTARNWNNGYANAKKDVKIYYGVY